MEKEKKPFYKKWWFWIIIVCIIVGIAGSNESGDNTNASKTTLTSTNEASPNIDSDNETNSAEKKTKYSVGEIYENRNIAIKYVAKNENFTQYNRYATIKAGHKIISADFEFENLGASDEYFSSYEFDCYADGYDCEAFWSVEGSGFSSTLSTGKKAKGTVYFQVPTTATSITIEYKINTFTGDKVEFLVK